MRKSLAFALALSTALLVAVWTPRALAEDPAVTLAASAPKIVFGAEVSLSGSIAPAAAGETVEIRDDADQVAATAATDAAGTFGVSLSPDRSNTYRAVWGVASSAPVTVAVRAVVSVRLPPVRLFDSVRVRGTVRPAVPGRKAMVTLSVAGDVVATEHARIGKAGGFSALFDIELPGTYRARATFSDAGHLPGSAVSATRTTPLPSLKEGSAGPFVELLEERLVALHYRLTRVDERYDFRTADAVVAFRKVQRMSRVFTVDAAIWRALADPLVPKPKAKGRGLHVEVDQTRQVLYSVEDGAITNILHISSGKPSTPTPDGSFQVYRKLAGFSGNHLYYPSYFNGLRALHGWTDVPTYAASHGCVRIPYWNALFIFGVAKLGTRVIVYH